MRSCRRVGVIGASGQLGTDLVEALVGAGMEPVAIPHSDMDVTDAPRVTEVLARLALDAVVNCAAYHRVDECEANVEETFRVNAFGALNVARACAAAGSRCVFISTDYVFGGGPGGPYDENAIPAPVNVYGAAKVAGELLVREACPDALIVRISSVFGRAGARGKGGNFIEAILAKARAGGPVRVVDDQWMSPTYTRDASAAIVALLDGDVAGVFHACNEGRCTWYAFAREAVRLAGLRVDVEAIDSRAFPTPARRPSDSSMRSVRAHEAHRMPPRPWAEALLLYLAEKGHMPS